LQTAIDPNLLAIDAYNEWLALATRPVQNNQTQDVELLKINAQRLGYAVMYSAGPASLFKLFKLEFEYSRPIDQSNANEIYGMIIQGDKYDWQHPWIVQIDAAGLSPEVLEAVSSANPNSLQSCLPIPLRALVHSPDILALLTTLWTERNETTGEYLTPDEMKPLQAKLKDWKKMQPTLLVLQGKQRSFVSFQLNRKAETLRARMVDKGRKGEMDEYKQLEQDLQTLVESTSFLLDVYPGMYCDVNMCFVLTCVLANLEPKSAELLAQNKPRLPEAPSTFGSLSFHLRRRFEFGHPTELDCNSPTCYQITQFGLSEYAHCPKSSAEDAAVAKVLQCPVVLQLALSYSSMIPVLDSCIFPQGSNLVKPNCGILRAHAWLSLELLQTVCLTLTLIVFPANDFS
jgi:hypothetical protein